MDLENCAWSMLYLLSLHLSRDQKAHRHLIFCNTTQESALIVTAKGVSSIRSIANKVKWDYTEFFLMIDLPSAGGKQRGMQSQGFRCGPASDFEKFANLPLPVQCEVEFDIVTGPVVNNKDTTKMDLLSIKPVLQLHRNTALACIKVTT